VRVIIKSLLVTALLVPTLSVAETLTEYGGTGGRHFSSAAQITPSNVASLERAWEFRAGELEGLSETQRKMADFQGTPLKLPEVAGDALVFCSTLQDIIAIDPGTGKERWRYDSGFEIIPERMLNICRGLAYWEDKSTETEDSFCKHRVILASGDRRLIAVDAITGKACDGFGVNGQVDMRPANDPFPAELVTHTSPPIVVNDTIVVGSSVEDFKRNPVPSGEVLGFNARTGEKLWSFNPIPEKGDGINWREDINPRDVSGSANVWSPMAADPELDLVFLPTSSAQPDFYGVDRAGDNRDANSLVALRASTGERVWAFQFVHHDIWDYDVGPQPIVTDLTYKGKTYPAVIQMTKQGYTFAFHRATGEPIWPITEIPVSQDGLPGQYLSPTQPQPNFIAPMLPERLSPDDAWGVTPLDRNDCSEKIAALRQQGPFTPLTEEWTLMLPAVGGGPNWGGGAVDEDKDLLIVNINTLPLQGRLKKRGFDQDIGELRMQGTDMTFGLGGTPYDFEAKPILSFLGTPCTQPSWGELVAIDINTGEYLWREPLGSIHEMGPVPLPFQINWGTPTYGGGIMTAGGVYFIGSTMDRVFRAFDVKTGAILWDDSLPADAMATPMTYEYQGRQYVIIASGGHHMSPDRPKDDLLIAYALPKK